MLVANIFFFTHLATWAAALLALIGWTAFALAARSYTRITFHKAQELAIWSQIAGDLGLTAPATRSIAENHPLLSVGPGFKRVLGWEEHGLVGTPWKEMIHPDDLAPGDIAVQGLINTGRMTNYCNRWRHKEPLPNGDPRWVWLEWTAITDNTLGMSFANACDMTSRFERETQMSTWSRITNDLMGVADTSIPIEERKFEWVNEAWERQLGWSLSELYNMPIIDLLKSSDSLSVLKQPETETKTTTGPHTMDCRLLCKGLPGQAPVYHYFEWSSVELNGTVYMTGRNVGDERSHHIEMAKVISDLEVRNADLERFASAAAHQLRSPPRTIAGIAQALKEDYDHLLDDEGRLFLEDIRLDADQMADIVDGLYRFSKVRTSADMNIEPVDLDALMETIYEAKRRGCWGGEDKDLVWDHLPTVLGDKVLLAEVLANLVDNGFKFNESERKVVGISAERRADGRWNIVVEDNGIGIDPTYQHKLFTMFERVHPSYSGTGVGLALVQAIINKFGGHVTVKSVPGEGAVFTFDMEGAWTG